MFSFYGAPRGHSTVRNTTGQAPNPDAYVKPTQDESSEAKFQPKRPPVRAHVDLDVDAFATSAQSAQSSSSKDTQKAAPPKPQPKLGGVLGRRRHLLSLDRADSANATFLQDHFDW